jgi:glycosyltransferase involved in cell wall biosynthesis
LRWWLKRIALAEIYRSLTCLYVGENNYDYYRAAGVPKSRLFYCPHSIDVERFAEPNEELERKAQAWRDELQIRKSARVLLYAGKFEKKKQPVELMKVVLDMAQNDLILIMIGNGELEYAVAAIASEHPAKFRVLPFQNQSRMPLVYRLGDVFTLPSAYGETWGLAVNEALACGRKVLVSDKVGCVPDVIISDEVGRVFNRLGVLDFGSKLRELLRQSTDRQLILKEARRFDLPATENALCTALHSVVDR